MEYKKESSYHDFKEKSVREQEDTKILEPLFSDLGFKFKQCKDTQLQKLGIDYLLKNETERKTVDVKIQYKKYNHPSEMLLETESRWHSNNKLYSLGWTVDESKVNDWVLDFCIETGFYFIYDTMKLRQWAKNNILSENNIPVKCYSRRVNNKKMQTTIVIVPRSYLKDCFITGGAINPTTGEIIL